MGSSRALKWAHEKCDAGLVCCGTKGSWGAQYSAGIQACPWSTLHPPTPAATCLLMANCSPIVCHVLKPLFHHRFTIVSRRWSSGSFTISPICPNCLPLCYNKRICKLVIKGEVHMVVLPISTVMTDLRSSFDELRESL